MTYTYRVERAPWLSSPEIQRVFPAVTRVVQGAGTAELKEGFTLTPNGWVANASSSAGLLRGAPHAARTELAPMNAAEEMRVTFIRDRTSA